MLCFSKEELATSWFIDYVFPFIKADSDQALASAFLKAAEAAFPMSAKVGLSIPSQSSLSCLNSFVAASSSLSFFLDLQSFITKFVKIALASRLSYRFPAKLKKTFPQLVSRAQALLLPPKQKLSWSGKSNCFIRLVLSDFAWPVLVEKVMIHCIVKCLYSSPNNLSGLGFSKIGLCIRCSLIFIKKKRNQICCSKLCLNAMSQRAAYRREKKISLSVLPLYDLKFD